MSENRELRREAGASLLYSYFLIPLWISGDGGSDFVSKGVLDSRPKWKERATP